MPPRIFARRDGLGRERRRPFDGTRRNHASEDTAARARRKKKVLLVDDHPMMRQGLAQLINQQEDLMVCAEAGDASDAMKLIDLLKPDLAMVDISLGGKSGLELIKDLQALHPEVPGLVMSMHDESLYAERMLRARCPGLRYETSGRGNRAAGHPPGVERQGLCQRKDVHQDSGRVLRSPCASLQIRH
jgi:CheY-like chemotaxis protein